MTRRPAVSYRPGMGRPILPPVVTPPRPDGVATITQAMKFLSRSRSTVLRILGSGAIVGVRDGRLWAIDWVSLYAYKDQTFAKKPRYVRALRKDGCTVHFTVTLGGIREADRFARDEWSIRLSGREPRRPAKAR